MGPLKVQHDPKEWEKIENEKSSTVKTLKELPDLQSTLCR